MVAFLAVPEPNARPEQADQASKLVVCGTSCPQLLLIGH
jgi:hypothetical protein